MRGNEEHSPVTRSVDKERHSDLIIWQNLLLLAIIRLVQLWPVSSLPKGSDIDKGLGGNQ